VAQDVAFEQKACSSAILIRDDVLCENIAHQSGDLSTRLDNFLFVFLEVLVAKSRGVLKGRLERGHRGQELASACHSAPPSRSAAAFHG